MGFVSKEYMENTIVNEKLESALKYAKMGWSIVPARGKNPCVKWKTFQEVRPTEDQIKGFWEKYPDANVAVITGPLSGILVLDIDTKHDRSPEEFDLPITVSSRTANGGWHYFFKHPGYEIKNDGGKIFGLGVDIRADSGVIILPPSDQGPDRPYSWTIEPTGDNLAPTPSWLEEKISEGRKPLSGALIASSEITDNPEVADLSPAEIPEGTRNDTLTRLTGTLLEKFKPDQWNSTVLSIITSFNQTNCKPPLPISEVRNIFNSISKAEMAKPKNKNEDKHIEILTAQELKNMPFPEAKWAVEGLFESNTVNMIGATPGSFKSWLSMHVANCLLLGKPVFNKFEVVKQSVWIINEEDMERQIQERMNFTNSEWESLPIYFSVNKGLKLDTAITEKIIEQSKERGVGFIIMDSLRSIHNKEENSSGEMQQVMDMLDKIANAGITVLFTHHNRKGGFGSKNEGDEARGSNAISAAVHSYISLAGKTEKGKDYVVATQHKQKGAKRQDPFRIHIDLSPDCDYDERFVYEGVESNFSQLKTKIVSMLSSNTKWIAVKDLATMNIGGLSIIRDALTELEKEGTIAKKTFKEVKDMGAEPLNEGQQHNTNLFSLANKGTSLFGL